MQTFWDSALALDPPDDYDTHRYPMVLYMLLLYDMACSFKQHVICLNAVISLASWLQKHQRLQSQCIHLLALGIPLSLNLRTLRAVVYIDLAVVSFYFT